MKWDDKYTFTQFGTQSIWNPELFFGITAVTLCLVIFGSLYKTWQLSGGGASVAEMLGGRQISPNTNEPNEKKILNIVEEMSIASGVPVPPVYLLDNEESINAFAAGFSTQNAIIAVTKGCVEQLNRDQLQGVVAHEFSHILNGDMRLNIRLLGLLNGILMIAMLGYALWRIGISTGTTSRRSRDEKGNPGAYIVIVGLALYALGYIGVFFANIIKAAVSRQREFLADASAVQFTRNPLGIGTALAKIGGFSSGSRLQAPAAQEVSHFFFADGIKASFLGLFATHPPLLERIEQIEPRIAKQIEKDADFSGAAEQFGTSSSSQFGASGFAGESKPEQSQTPLTPPSDSEAAPKADTWELDSLIGSFQEKHLEFARKILKSIPDSISRQIRDPSGARAVVYALLISPDNEIEKKQLSWLGENCDSLVVSDVSKVIQDVKALKASCKLPLISSLLPALRHLPQQAYMDFRTATQYLIEADNQCSLFEYALQRMLRRHIDPFFVKATKKELKAIGKLETNEAALQLVASLASLTQSEPSQVEKSFEAGIKELGNGGFSSRPAPKNRSLAALDDALYALQDSRPAIKRSVFRACVATICADKTISVDEAELIRAIADGLDCPIPPFTPA